MTRGPVDLHDPPKRGFVLVKSFLRTKFYPDEKRQHSIAIELLRKWHKILLGLQQSALHMYNSPELSAVKIAI